MEKRFAFIGAGNMASAIIGGLTDKTAADAVPEAQITLFDKNPAQYDRYGTGFVRASSAADAARDADIVVLAIKPQNYAEVLDELGRTDTHGKIFISIAAGISTAFVETYLGSDAAVVRTMPNTPLLIGKGVTALCRNKNVSDAQFDLVEHIFASRGATLRLDEADMNKIIAATSSSPAYIFLMIKAICDGAAAEGIRCDNLRDAVCNMVIGSAELALRSDKGLDELIRMVTSPKGTTEKALEVFYAAGFEKTVAAAMDACTHRADELAQG